MRIILALMLLLLGEWLAPAQKPSPTLEKLELFGHAYVRLNDWARGNDFDLKWQPPGTNTTVPFLYIPLLQILSRI